MLCHARLIHLCKMGNVCIPIFIQYHDTVYAKCVNDCNLTTFSTFNAMTICLNPVLLFMVPRTPPLDQSEHVQTDVEGKLSRVRSKLSTFLVTFDKQHLYLYVLTIKYIFACL